MRYKYCNMCVLRFIIISEYKNEKQLLIAL